MDIMIKINNTQNYKDKLVCEGVLKMVDSKPIVISKSEKIEEGSGELVYDSWEKRIAFMDKRSSIGHPNYKILALPEHFSPEQLQMIVDGKLKDGDRVLVECEQIDVDEAYAEVQANHQDYFTHHFHHYDSGRKTFKKEFEHLYRTIKLDPHITIYPVEEKMVPVSLLKEAFEAGKICYQCDGNEGTDWNTWFEQNVK